MTDDLSTLLRTPLTGAVLRIDRDPAGSAAFPVDQLRTVGWNPVTAAGFTDRDGFYTAIAAALDFPSYFGRNLDALWDLLRDLEAPTVLFLSWRDFEVADPSSAGRVLAVLRQRAATAPAFAVVLAS